MPESIEFLTPADLRDTLRAMAAVGLLRLGPAGFRDHFFRVVPGADVAVALWGDFAGNSCRFLFHPAGSVILGFDHESPMSPHASCTGPDDFRAWPGVYDSLPAQLMEAVRGGFFAPEFDFREVTFCLWNQSNTKQWLKGDIEYPEGEPGSPDGQGYILNCVRNYCLGFVEAFQEIYSWELDEEAVAELLSGDEITRDCLQRLAGECDPDACALELKAMGFRLV